MTTNTTATTSVNVDNNVIQVPSEIASDDAQLKTYLSRAYPRTLPDSQHITLTREANGSVSATYKAGRNG